jgi:hypothetical protein
MTTGLSRANAAGPVIWVNDTTGYGVAGTQIFSMNATTGAGTLTADYAGQGLVAANGAASTNLGAPEPATLSILRLAGLGLLVRRHRS